MKRCPQCHRVESDEGLKFCRVDGTALINDSSTFNSEAGTIQLGTASASSEIGASMLPHPTDEVMNRATAPTTVLAAPQTQSATRELNKPGRHGLVFALIASVILGVAIAGYFYFSRKSDAIIQSIAVMPFVNDTGDADVEYLSDGMTETLIKSLSQIPNLAVKSRTTVFTYKGKQTTPKSIGQELGVQAVLNGRFVGGRGDQLHLNLELVDTQTENVIWTDDYDRRPSISKRSPKTRISRLATSALLSSLASGTGRKQRNTFCGH